MLVSTLVIFSGSTTVITSYKLLWFAISFEILCYVLIGLSRNSRWFLYISLFVSAKLESTSESHVGSPTESDSHPRSCGLNATLFGASTKKLIPFVWKQQHEIQMLMSQESQTKSCRKLLIIQICLIIL